MLSKSDFTAGLQCLKRLYLQKNHPELKSDEKDSDAQRRIVGLRVGALGRGLVPGGFIVGEGGMPLTEAARLTESALAQESKVLYEAAFVSANAGCRADILARSGSGWVLTEVKSSSKVKPEHIQDVAFQSMVIEASGTPLAAVQLAVVNCAENWMGGELRPETFFELHDITGEVHKKRVQVAADVDRMTETLAGGTVPEIETNNFCRTPFKCPFFDRCHQNQPPDDLTFLPGIHAKQVTSLRAAGYRTIGQVPPGLLKTEIQRRTQTAISTGKSYVGTNLGHRLAEIKFPAAFLDFEAVSSPFPIFIGTRAYETIPFQWSCHVLDSGRAEARHFEYLGKPDEDPREEFVRSLERLLEGMQTVVYYSSYEITTLRQLGQRGFRGADELHRFVTEHGVDLLAVIKSEVYLPEFKGSFSIKSVLPAMMGEGVSYKNLAIQDGSMAANEYLRMIGPATSVQEQAIIRTNLLEYCKLDTLAMVLLFGRLRELAESAPRPVRID